MQQGILRPFQRIEHTRAWPMTVMIVVLGLVAMLLTPVSAALAAPGDFAWGTVYADAQKNSVIDPSGPEGEADRGVEGATVMIVDATNTVVATTTTNANGEYAFPTAPAGLAPFVVRVNTSTSTAGDVYAFQTRGAAPNISADRSIPVDGENDFSVYPIWYFELAIMSGDGLGGKRIFTGADPFDLTGGAPGLDTGKDNDIVRSSDVVAFEWSITAKSEEPLADSFTDAVFEQTINLGPGAVANFTRIPASCDASKSEIRAFGGTNPPGGTKIDPLKDPLPGTTSVVLTCNLGQMGDDRNSILPFPTNILPSAASVNGSEFTTDARMYGVDPNGAATARPGDAEQIGPIEITSTPRYDIEKHQGSIGNYGYSTVNGVNTYGMYAYYTIQISTDRKVGVEAFQQPITIEESFWATNTDGAVNDLRWYIDLCQPSPASTSGGQSGATTVYGKIGTGASLATAQNSVRDSGTCSIGATRTGGDQDRGNYELTFSGIDASGATYPTQTYGGQPLAAGPFYVASYRLRVFVPITEIDRMDGVMDGNGSMRVSNRVGEFEPVGVSGAENFGGAGEPGFCEADPRTVNAPNPGTTITTGCDPMPETDVRSNNIAGDAALTISPGTWTKYFYDNRIAWGNSVALVPEQSGSHSGDGMVQPEQTFSTRITLGNTASEWSSAEFCDVFDNTVLQLAPLDKDIATGPSWNTGMPAGKDRYAAVLLSHEGTWLNAADQQAYQDDWEFMFGYVDLTGDNANTGVYDIDHARYEGDWTQQRAATNGANVKCGSSDIDWKADPTEVTNGIDAVNIIWARSKSGVVIPGGDSVYFMAAWTQRDTYNGGPNAGQTILAGTISANFANVKTSRYAPNWAAAGYVPGAGTVGVVTNRERPNADVVVPGGTWQSNENTSGQGDRWTLQRATMRLTKHTVAGTVDGVAASGVSPEGVTGSAIAGKPIIWQINTTLSAASDTPGPVQNVVVTDTLPKFITYNEAATVALAAAEGFPAPASVTENGDGTTTVVWNLGTRVPNQPLPTLKIVTTADPLAPTNTSVTNLAVITANGMTPVTTHRDDHTVVLEQTGEVQMKKSVDRTLDLQNDTQAYTLQMKNFSTSSGITTPTIIEVLPYNNDGSNAANVNRSPQSDYAGTSQLTAAPTVTDFAGGGGITGTFYYTTVPSANVPQHLSDDTNPAIWSTTFTPTATAFKFVANVNLTSTVASQANSGLEIKFTTQQTGNDPGDLYANRFTAFTPDAMISVPGSPDRYQMLTSNQVTVRVIGFSLGDFVFFDVDNDGKYTVGTDRPAPEGVVVQVRDEAGAIVKSTTTNDEGRWIVNDLARGKYYVTIPASEFGTGGRLAGTLPAKSATDAGTASAGDNETADHHAIAGPGGVLAAGVRSSGLIELDADTTADPLRGLGPLGDNVAGLVPSPMTTDDFTYLTLDLGLVPPAKFNVTKKLDTTAVTTIGTTPTFTINVACTLEGQAVPGYPKDLTFAGAGTQDIVAPLGSTCTATETAQGGATTVTITPTLGITLTSETADENAELEVTNTYLAGSLKITKETAGPGAGLAERDFVFTIVCTFNGLDNEVLNTTRTVTIDGEGSGTSTDVTGIPVGSACSITETGNGGADKSPAAVELVIDNDPQTVQNAGFTNRFSAGTVSVTKELDGPLKDTPFLQSLRFEVLLTCAVAAIDPEDDPLELYSGIEWIKAGESFSPTGLDDEPILFPLGTRCWAEELSNQGASETLIVNQDFESGVVVTRGETDLPQELSISIVNTFEQAKLTVSKKVVGPDPGTAFEFELQCFYPIDTEDGIEDAEVLLVDADAKFSLKGGESREIFVPVGASCKVTEVNVPEKATVTIVDSDATSVDGAADGIVLELEGDANSVEFTNTFPALDVAGTGSTTTAMLLWSSLGLVLLGAVLVAARRRRVGTEVTD